LAEEKKKFFKVEEFEELYSYMQVSPKV